MTKIVDLSHLIVSDPPELPDFLRSEVSYNDHAYGAGEFEQLLSIDRSLLLREEGPAGERLSIGTHSVTHLDAPYHYNSTIQGRPSETIDELPLEWFFAPGVVLDFSDRGDGEVIEAGELEAAIGATGHELAPRDIVLIRTGRDALYEDRDYMRHGPGVSVAATSWLFERGVRVMGIDAWGWDRPLYMQAEEALARDEPGIFWAAHQCDLPYCQIERLFNLDQLPSSGFHVACFPLRLMGASAAPARVVALLGLGD
jgi:kynurenine formamidase